MNSTYLLVRLFVYIQHFDRYAVVRYSQRRVVEMVKCIWSFNVMGMKYYMELQFHGREMLYGASVPRA